MTTIVRAEQPTTEKAYGLCQKYVRKHGNDTGLPAFLKLQAKLWDMTGRPPQVRALEDVIGLLYLDAEVDAGNFLPDGWKVSHPEHGPAVSAFKDGNDQQVTILLAQALEGRW